MNFTGSHIEVIAELLLDLNAKYQVVNTFANTIEYHSKVFDRALFFEACGQGGME